LLTGLLMTAGFSFACYVGKVFDQMI